MEDDCQLPSIYMELYNVTQGFYPDEFDQLGSGQLKNFEASIVGDFHGNLLFNYFRSSNSYTC